MDVFRAVYASYVRGSAKVAGGADGVAMALGEKRVEKCSGSD